jgi:hypothetical protein
MTLADRLTNLESQLADHTRRRDQAHAILQESQTAILQLQGAIALCRDLLSTNGAPPEHGSSAVAEAGAVRGDGAGAIGARAGCGDETDVLPQAVG